MACARRRSRAAAFPLVRPSWASIGVSPGRCGRASVADVTLTELRDQLAFTIGSLSALRTNAAFCADMAGDPDVVALYQDLAALCAELAKVAGEIVEGERT